MPPAPSTSRQSRSSTAPGCAELFSARQVRLSPRLVRAAASGAFRLRLQPSEPGWLDMALAVPLMDTSRARERLGWEPRRSAVDAFSELLDGLRDGSGLETPPLEPGGAGPLRAREFLAGSAPGSAEGAVSGVRVRVADAA